MQVQLDDKGLVPAIAQDAKTGQVLMMAYMDAEALRRTLESGQAWFYSRSRRELWHKGATSGHYLNVRGVSLDCDGDTILLQVEPTGPACHTGATSCFFTPLAKGGVEFPDLSGPAAPRDVLRELAAVIEERKRTKPESSYTAKLLQGGIDRVGQKVIEEAGEAALAAMKPDKASVASEVADLWYHTLVLLAACDLKPEDVWEELRKRRK